jgi:predicted nucleotidyltransferase
LYGTATPRSDTDYIEVHLPTKDQIFGLGDKWATFPQTLGEHDVSRFGVNQYIKLLAKGNPNVLETIFCPEDRMEVCHDAFRTLAAGEEQTMPGVAAILHKDSIIHAHLGFAIQQTNKMMPAKAKWAGPRREALFDQYGYDVKYAAHAIRLVHQCLEVLDTGYISYPYQPAMVTYLQDIRKGKYKLQEIRDKFAYELKRVEHMKKLDCAINNEDKTSIINGRLIAFYETMGYAACKHY